MSGAAENQALPRTAGPDAVEHLIAENDAGGEARAAGGRVGERVHRRRLRGAAAEPDGRRRPLLGRRDRQRPGPDHPDVRHHSAGTARRRAPAGRRAGAGHGLVPLRDSRPGTRGVLGRTRRLESHCLPGPAGVGRQLQPGTRPRNGRADRRGHAGAGRTPRPGPRAGRGARPPLGPRGGDHRRRPVPGGHRGVRLRAGARGGGHRGHPQALRGLLRLRGRPQPRPRFHGPARTGRRDAAAVRDGPQARRLPVGNARLHGRRRRPVRRQPGLAHRAAPR